MVFMRGLNQEFIAALNKEYGKTNSWWKVLVDQPAYIVAIRNDYLNVYRNGCSIARISFENGSIISRVNYKYLIKKTHKQKEIALIDGVPQLKDPVSYFIDSIADTASVISITDRYGGTEKTGVHKIILDNDNIIDTEISMSKTSVDDEDNADSRIDICAVRFVNGLPVLRFIEAKDVGFSSALRSGKESEPGVVEQLNRYEKFLVERRSEIILAYQALFATIKQLDGNRILGKQIDSSNMERLSVETKPYLAIFGFDSDHRDNKESAHNRHLDRLKELIGKDRILTKGDPKDFTKGISR